MAGRQASASAPRSMSEVLEESVNDRHPAGPDRSRPARGDRSPEGRRHLSSTRSQGPGIHRRARAAARRCTMPDFGSLSQSTRSSASEPSDESDRQARSRRSPRRQRETGTRHRGFLRPPESGDFAHGRLSSARSMTSPFPGGDRQATCRHRTRRRRASSPVSPSRLEGMNAGEATPRSRNLPRGISGQGTGREGGDLRHHRQDAPKQSTGAGRARRQRWPSKLGFENLEDAAQAADPADPARIRPAHAACASSASCSTRWPRRRRSRCLIAMVEQRVLPDLAADRGRHGSAGKLDADDAGKDDETLKAEYRAIAERRVRLGLLLAEIGRPTASRSRQRRDDPGHAHRGPAVSRPGVSR